MKVYLAVMFADNYRRKVNQTFSLVGQLVCRRAERPADVSSFSKSLSAFSAEKRDIIYAKILHTVPTAMASPLA